MRALKKARRIIETDPTSSIAQHLASLVLALEAEGAFELANLYQVDMDTFELMLEMLKEWRLDRYYVGKAKLFDLSLQARSLAA
jgi:anion-transporting  ArsA/GET3 family ATPase